MTKKKDDVAMCTSCALPSGCRVEAKLGVDERGQMGLPKEVKRRRQSFFGDRSGGFSS